MSQMPFKDIATFYNQRVMQFGYDHRACDYGRAVSQTKKFEVLSAALDHSDQSILDVGCGFADYADYLSERYLNIKYTGFDLSSEMIGKAKCRLPELDLRVVNLLEETDGTQYDIVNANGIFYLLGDQAPKLMQDLVTAMFQRCKKAVTFNSLSLWAPERDSGEFYANPAEVVEWCRKLTPWVTLRHDYMPHDFTVYLYRNQVF
jgi:SAM-dependent methyltransferase